LAFLIGKERKKKRGVKVSSCILRKGGKKKGREER